VTPENVALPVHLADRERPFWGYAELLIVVALFLPAVWVGGQAVEAASGYLHIDPKRGLPLLVAEFLGYAIVFGALRLLFARYGEPLFASLGWVPHNFNATHLIATGLFLALLVIILGNILGFPNVETPFDKLLNDPVSRIAIAAFGVSLGPIVEVLLFRGFLQPLLVETFGVLYGILATSVLFGAVHLTQNAYVWQSGVLITLVGFVLGVVRHLSGSTRASAITHLSYNALPFLFLLISGKA
jgi:membrane protease YdiL (CAAX protease family)